MWMSLLLAMRLPPDVVASRYPWWQNLHTPGPDLSPGTSPYPSTDQAR